MNLRRAAVGFVVSTGLALAAAVAAAFLLPDRVPTHFDLSGAADAWGSRRGAVVFSLATTLGLAALFAVLAWFTPKIPWEWVNLPGKHRWSEPDQQDRVRQVLRRELLWMGAATSVLVGSLTVATVQTARDGTDRLPGWFAVVMVVWFVTVLGRTIVLARMRPPDRREGFTPDGRR